MKKWMCICWLLTIGYSPILFSASNSLNMPDSGERSLTEAPLFFLEDHDLYQNSGCSFMLRTLLANQRGQITQNSWTADGTRINPYSVAWISTQQEEVEGMDRFPLINGNSLFIKTDYLPKNLLHACFYIHYIDALTANCIRDILHIRGNKAQQKKALGIWMFESMRFLYSQKFSMTARAWLFSRVETLQSLFPELNTCWSVIQTRSFDTTLVRLFGEERSRQITILKN